MYQEKSDFFHQNGYVVVHDFLTAEQIVYLRTLYDDFIDGRIDAHGHRSDLSGAETQIGTEKIVQIMRPSLLVAGLDQSAMHQKALHIARLISGDDMALDFDMLIDKPVYTDAPTPWHQDEAYWVDMPDKRAMSCWVALDPVRKENGCMWFVPGSHQQAIRHHVQTGTKGALSCHASEDEAHAVEMPAGSCTFHHGRTLHYSRGNATNERRRAFIMNFRPEAMIAFEREKGFDHLGQREVRSAKKS